MYSYKDPYIIDFSSVKDTFEMHSVIAEALDFPDYYGHNLDALWDCLRDISCESFHLEIRGFDNIKALFPDKAEAIIEMLKELREFHADEPDGYITICLAEGEERTYIE